MLSRSNLVQESCQWGGCGKNFGMDTGYGIQDTGRCPHSMLKACIHPPAATPAPCLLYPVSRIPYSPPILRRWLQCDRIHQNPRISLSTWQREAEGVGAGG